MWKRWVISIVVNALSLMIVATIFDDFYLSSVSAAVIAAIVLSIINIIIKPILILFTLPATILTLGLFLFVINAITLMITQGIIGDAFIIDGFSTALFAAIIMALLNLIAQKAFIEPMQR
ncbi:phage holin family protein [Priestia endophytica]|jgi:putative membrane protein|uniref:Membrane protein n=1 Tax=Priestia endophytica DSM 13796 TaxID=1121089 RepID=A0A1I5ZYT5_9BACI|nr:phage holin family protein [Priestia endophytica]KAB2492368.1 phage holin family protein [Priestia endophytica]KYG28454.1 hypothetical protein AZF06_10805 [Priestia endophytica]MBG9810664.1 membrane protein [Priestia endophytica]MED4071310.1 phage holin family protein [Priestia endophytica]RAS81189.1 hypothetical protein A4R27_11560 [Priestia endophytica]